MEKPFFSVVMPVYKVEKYLEQAVNSILAQTFGDYEVLLIDDCSPDHSPDICDRLAKADQRIQVIHLEKNGGVSHARNLGMDKAIGTYLFFMDSDDYIDDTLFASVWQSIQDNPAQIVFFGMTEERFSSSGQLLESMPVALPTRQFKDQSSLRDYMMQLEKSTLYGYACNKFYNLDYLRSLKIRYEEYALNEDILFHVQKMQALWDQYNYWGMCTQQIRCDLAAIYTRYIMSALQRNCDPRSQMSLGKRKCWLKRLYEQKLFNELIPYGKPHNPVVRILHMCLKKHWTLLTLILGRVIYIVKSKMPGVFNIVQKNR